MKLLLTGRGSSDCGGDKNEGDEGIGGSDDDGDGGDGRDRISGLHVSVVWKRERERERDSGLYDLIHILQQYLLDVKMTYTDFNKSWSSMSDMVIVGQL